MYYYEVFHIKIYFIICTNIFHQASFVYVHVKTERGVLGQTVENTSGYFNRYILKKGKYDSKFGQIYFSQLASLVDGHVRTEREVLGQRVENPVSVSFDVEAAPL